MSPRGHGGSRPRPMYDELLDLDEDLLDDDGLDDMFSADLHDTLVGVGILVGGGWLNSSLSLSEVFLFPFFLF